MSKHVAVSREYESNSKTNGIVEGVLLLVLGLITALTGQGMINLIVLVTGIVMIVLGVVAYLDTRVIEVVAVPVIFGAILAVLGYMGLASEIVRYIVGIVVVLVGATILLGTQSKNFAINISFGDRVINAVIGVVLILLGIFAMINYYDSFGWIIRVIGVLVAVVGLMKILRTLGILSK
ncbi:MAG: hypothetical protein MJZ21_01865 [archaeon]|nr:hypothetical protein [archaeon]